jgi:GntR family transcriptional regulator/MocR family aminotransferase
MSTDDSAVPSAAGGTSGALDVERDSDVPISTQIYWQLAYQIDSGRLLPGSRLPPVRELGAALRVNPNTIRAVYRRLADAGYVNSRHGAGTHVADRPPQRRGAENLAGSCPDAAPRGAAGVHARRARRATFARQYRAEAPRAARPRPVRRVHQRRRRLRRRTLVDEFPVSSRPKARCSTTSPERLDRFHYDLIATTTFHADEAQVPPPDGSRSWRCSSVPATSSSVHETPGCRAGRGSAMRAPRRAARQHPRDARDVRHGGVEILSAIIGSDPDLR